MRPLVVGLILLSVSTQAAAEPASSRDQVRFVSSGRDVEVEVYDEGRCRTPCEMSLSPGAYRLRVDGLNRHFNVATGRDRIVVQPVRYPLLVLGAILLAGGSTGVTLASHWGSPLNKQQRLQAGLGGLALLGVSLPMLIWSSASVDDNNPRRTERAAQQEEFILSAGLAQRSGFDFDGRALRLTASLGYRFPNSRLSVAANGQYAAFANDGAIGATIGPSVHLARLPIISVAAGARVGFETRKVQADEAVELEFGEQRETSGLLELTTQLRIEVPWPVKPVFNFNYEVSKYDDWNGRFVAATGLSATF